TNRTLPCGSDVVRAPCPRQKLHWHARIVHSPGGRMVCSSKRIDPQRKTPSKTVSCNARSGCRGDIFIPQKNLFLQRARERHHFIGSLRSAADAQARIALGDEPAGDGMEDFVESGIADALRSGRLD